jgi:hypothetical protein
MIKIGNLCNNSGIRSLHGFVLEWYVFEGTHKAMNGSGNFGSELTENIRQFQENRFYGTLKPQEIQCDITNAYKTYLHEKSVLKIPSPFDNF